MGDTNMDKDDDLLDYNEVDPEDLIAGNTQNAPNKGDGDSPEELDWTFDCWLVVK